MTTFVNGLRVSDPCPLHKDLETSVIEQADRGLFFLQFLSAFLHQSVAELNFCCNFALTYKQSNIKYEEYII